jgi:predicted nuclease of predicted toxin-antitoxin system
MRFLVDAQLPPALARWLETKGHAADHVEDLRLLNADDAEIWNHALSVNAAIVTKDVDFSIRTVISSSGPPVIWIRLGNTTNRALLERLDSLWPEIEHAMQRGEKLIEVV